METNYIALSVPVFAILIVVEAAAARWSKRPYYRFNDSVNDVSCGVIQQLSKILIFGFLVGGYLGIYEWWRLFEISADSPWTWVACFVLVDFAYYWFHRLSHEINFLWAAHIVHHQSEEYNLTVALRQSAFQGVFSTVFYWPLALLGFPPVVFLACSAFNTLYQFWIHTRLIDTLGLLEWILMTPSHHRVHHGRNPIYIDRNHGGTFIFWDKLFGTFQREDEEVVYGITTPLGSWNPIWANFHYWAELWRAAQRTQSWRDKLQMFLRPPGWFPDDLGGFQPPPEIGPSPTKFDLPYRRLVGAYAALQFGQLVLLSAALMNFGAQLDASTQAMWAGAIAWGLVNMGGLFESRPWAAGSELARVAATSLLALTYAGPGLWVSAALALNLLPAAWLQLRERAAAGSPRPRDTTIESSASPRP